MGLEKKPLGLQKDYKKKRKDYKKITKKSVGIIIPYRHWIGHICSPVFFCQKEQKVRFQTDFQGKPNITVRQFSQNVTVFYVRYSVLSSPVLGQKKNKT